MEKIRNAIRRVMPEYGFLPVIAAFMFNNVVYGGSKIIAGDWYHHNIESGYDKMIPFIPETLIIYFGCYLFWCVNYILIAKQDKKSVYQFFVGDFISRCVCLAFYLIYPTTNTRPDLAGGGFWNQAMGFLYGIDSASNLFPSIHCLVSWFCFIAIRGKKNIPLWYRTFSCIMAIAVFISTLTTKQHVLVDVAGGILLAELCFWIGKHTRLYLYYGKVFDRLTAILFPGKKGISSAEQEEGSF